MQKLKRLHLDWVRSIRYVTELDALVSTCCETTTAMCITCLQDMKSKYFCVSKGVICFDYSTVSKSEDKRNVNIDLWPLLVDVYLQSCLTSLPTRKITRSILRCIIHGKTTSTNNESAQCDLNIKTKECLDFVSSMQCNSAHRYKKQPCCTM